jgi:hypothetical protein
MIMASRKLEDNVWYECANLVDYSPLLAVMYIVAYEIRERGASFDKPKARRVWIEVMTKVQDEWRCSDHNSHIPCRSCDQAFRPVIDDALLTMFLPWYETRTNESLIAIHRCPSCGGSIAATDTKTYDGDYHTPDPGSIDDDDEWAETLLDHVEM